jgi:hypothetical protein
MTPRPLHVLVLYWSPGGTLDGVRPAIRHHLQFLESSPARHRVSYWNVGNPSPAWLGWLGWLAWDAVVLHTTALGLRWSAHFAAAKWRLRWLGRLRCPVVALPQDEYDHCHVLDDWLFELGASVVCTNFGEDARALFYPLMQGRAAFRPCFTGYLDEATARGVAPRLTPAAARPLDLVYRAAHLPYWFGSQGQLKHRISARVAPRAEALGLRCDLSTRPQDTFTSDAWFDFLASSRAVLGCESGSSVLDRRGEMQARVYWLLAQNPGATFEEVAARMPAGWDDYHFLAVGPRHFEAVLTRTCQVLVEGEYDGVLKPHVHYLPLRRDLGNLDEVLHQVKDAALLDRLTARAYEDVCLSGRYTYRALAGLVEGVVPRRRLWTGWPRHPGAAVRLALVVPAGAAVVAGPVARAAGLVLGAAWQRVRFVYGRAAEEAGKLARCLGLVLGSRACRCAWRKGLLTGALWKTGAAVPLFKDLAKLAVLGKHLRVVPGKPGVPHVLPRVEAGGRKLVFVSVPAGAAPPGPGPDPGALERALGGAPYDIWWDHSRVGTYLRYPLRRKRGTRLYLGGDGVHHFAALGELARHRPDLVRRLLREVLNPTGGVRAA